MNHQRREALSQAVASVLRSIDMVERYVDLKCDDIHMQSCGDKVKTDTCECWDEAHLTDIGEGINQMVWLLESLKRELSE